MGLIYSNARLLLESRRDGCSFDRVITLGRQQIKIDTREYHALAKEFPDFLNDPNATNIASEYYADRFILDCLGCRKLESIDLCRYQDATITHDLNEAIDAELHRQFDVVIDGGTLEHIFNFPVAIKNCMELVCVGGYVMLASTANNYCGHGFYQFSPELFFRVFQPKNGFEIRRVILIEHPFPGAELSRHQRCYEVIDPDVIRERVGLVGPSPVMIQVLAKRISDVRSLEVFPQQSDYEHLWETASGPAALSHLTHAAPPFSQLNAIRKARRIVGNTYREIEKRLPASMQRWFNGRRQLRDYSLANRKFYRPW